MSSPLSRASSRWLIISLCRKSSIGIVVLLPVSIVSGLYGSPDAFQGDFVSALEQTTSFISSLHVRTLHRRSPDFPCKAPRATAAPATPMLHFHAGWVSNHVRGLLDTACSPKSPTARSCPSIGAKSPSGSAVDFGSSVI